jgi:hypothetical protein
MTTQVSRRSALASIAACDAAADAIDTESLLNKLPHLEHIDDRDQLRQLAYDAADRIRCQASEIKRLRVALSEQGRTAQA